MILRGTAPRRAHPAATEAVDPTYVGTIEVTAPSLPEAIERAVATYGAGVKVVSARRIRRGLRGLLGDSLVCLEVDPFADEPPGPAAPPGYLTDTATEPAAPAAGPAGAEGALAEAIAHLIADADISEDTVVTVTGTSRPMTFAEPIRLGAKASPVVDDAELGIEAAEIEDDLEDDLGELTLRQSLRALGMPPAVLGRLPLEEPTEPAEQLALLTRILTEMLPPPGKPTADHPVTIDGYGVEGAISIIRASLGAGVTPGRLVIDERPARPATAKKLAEVILACVS